MLHLFYFLRPKASPQTSSGKHVPKTKQNPREKSPTSPRLGQKLLHPSIAFPSSFTCKGDHGPVHITSDRKTWELRGNWPANIQRTTTISIGISKNWLVHAGSYMLHGTETHVTCSFFFDTRCKECPVYYIIDEFLFRFCCWTMLKKHDKQHFFPAILIGFRFFFTCKLESTKSHL